MKRHSRIGCFTCILGLAGQLHAQAIPVASRTRLVQIGVGGSLANPDYSQNKIGGMTVYGTYDFTRHIGIEGTIQRVDMEPSGLLMSFANTSANYVEDTFVSSTNPRHAEPNCFISPLQGDVRV